MSRSLSEITKEAGRWIKDARTHYNWTQQDLIERITDLRHVFRIVRVPSIEEVESLEAERERYLPGWVKFARLAVEAAGIESQADLARWAEARSVWQSDIPHDDFDCCWPLVTRPEYYLLEHLDQMREEDRRFAFRLAAAWNSPYATRNKVFNSVIAALSERMHVPPPPILPEPVRSLPAGLSSLLYKFTPDDVMVLKAYLSSDDEGRTAIAQTALTEICRCLDMPE